MNKVLYIVKTKLHYYPPCVSQIRMLKDLGYDVEVLYGTSNDSALKLLRGEGIPCHKVANIKEENPSFTKKIVSWYKFRVGLLKTLKNYDSDALLWFGTAETVIPMMGTLGGKNYVVSLLELLDDSPKKIKLLKEIVKNAKAVTVCEETRGYIMRYWWNLKEVPFVFPNKPYNQITDRRHQPSIPETREVIEQIKDKRVILYQGIIQNTEELIEIAKALRAMDSEYILLLMGIDKYNSVDRIKAIYDKVIYVSYIPAPYHLEITSYARIGITFYRNDSLNKAFCAPNKIYEYTGFGIPIIANDIPGLKNTIGNIGAAECMDLVEDNVINAIRKIDSNYEQYSSNALKFFEGTDNLRTMQILMKSIEV